MKRYVHYYGGITKTGVDSLIKILTIIVMDKTAQPVEEVIIGISSGGGDNQASLVAHNFMKNYPLKLTTHNVGYCNSATNILFMAGKERKATPHSLFTIHNTKTTFQPNATLSELELIEVSQGLRIETDIFAKIYADVCGIEPETTRGWFAKGIVMDANEARRSGIVTEICDLIVPFDADPFFVVTEATK
jgi:ATP-dependent Clp protease protease subunit